MRTRDLDSWLPSSEDLLAFNNLVRLEPESQLLSVKVDVPSKSSLYVVIRISRMRLELLGYVFIAVETTVFVEFERETLAVYLIEEV